MTSNPYDRKPPLVVRPLMIADGENLQVTGDGRGPTDDGFTLMEIIVVILLMMVIAAATMPVLLRMGRNARLKSATRQVDAFLRGARHRAIMEGKFAHVRWQNEDYAPADGKIDASTMEAAFTDSASTPDWDNMVRALTDLHDKVVLEGMNEAQYKQALAEFDRVRVPVNSLTLPEHYVFSDEDGATAAGALAFFPDGSTAVSVKLRLVNQDEPGLSMSLNVFAGAGLVEVEGPPTEDE